MIVCLSVSLYAALQSMLVIITATVEYTTHMHPTVEYTL